MQTATIDQPAQPRNLIRVFADRVCLLEPPGYPKTDKQDLLAYQTDVQADLSICWSHRSYRRFCHALGIVIMIIIMIMVIMNMIPYTVLWYYNSSVNPLYMLIPNMASAVAVCVYKAICCMSFRVSFCSCVFQSF